MIKIKINEGRFTNALTAKAQSLNVKLPKPEQQPKSVEQPVQLQEPEQQIKKDQVIQYNNEFYSFTTSAKAKKSSWHKIVDGMYELIKDENLINDLNNFATNKKQVATTAPLDLEDAPTEEASTPVTVQEVSNEINYPDLLSQVGSYFDFRKQDNVIDFIDNTVEFLQSNENFKSIYQQIEKQIEELSLGIFNDQRKQQRIKDLTNDLIGAADDLTGLVTEVIDPITGLSILLGTISLGTLIGGLNYKRLRQKSNQTPEGRYLFLLGLEVKLLIIKSIIDGNDITEIQNLITTKIKPDLEEFKKPSLNLFKQKNLLNEKNKQLEDLAATVAQLIRQKADDQSPSVGLNESTVNRWKQLAGIRG